MTSQDTVFKKTSLKWRKHLAGDRDFNTTLTLPGVTQWVGCCPTKRKVTGLTAGQGPGLGCRFGPGQGVYEATDQCSSLTALFLSLSLPLPSSLPRNK